MTLPTFSLAGKVAVVTGAGGKSGMGLAMAMMFAEAGADVAICDIVAKGDDRNLADAADRIRALGRRSIGIKADVSKKIEVDQMVQRVTDDLGPVDILVNNAGILGNGRILDMDEDDWDQVMDVNLKSCYLCCHAVAKSMVERRTGCIISVSSINGFNAVPGREI